MMKRGEKTILFLKKLIVKIMNLFSAENALILLSACIVLAILEPIIVLETGIKPLIPDLLFFAFYIASIFSGYMLEIELEEEYHLIASSSYLEPATKKSLRNLYINFRISNALLIVSPLILFFTISYERLVIF
jgi:hypothetical protein